MKYKFTLPKQEKIQTDIIGEDVQHPFFILSKDGVLTIKEKYSWDGMSFYPDDKTTYLASLYHDCLYQIIRIKLLDYKYKSNADRLMYRTLLRDGHPKKMSLVAYIGVVIFGRFFL